MFYIMFFFALLIGSICFVEADEYRASQNLYKAPTLDFITHATAMLALGIIGCATIAMG